MRNTYCWLSTAFLTLFGFSSFATASVINCPSNIVIDCSKASDPVDFRATARDDAGRDLPVICVPPVMASPNQNGAGAVVNAESLKVRARHASMGTDASVDPGRQRLRDARGNLLDTLDKNLAVYTSSAGGLLTNRKDTLNTQLRRVDQQFDNIQKQYDSYYNRYLRQYTSLMQTMAAMEQTYGMF